MLGCHLELATVWKDVRPISRGNTVPFAKEAHGHSVPWNDTLESFPPGPF